MKLFASVDVFTALIMTFGCSYALCVWKDFQRSRTAVMVTYGVALAIPFMVFYLPWFDIVDMNEHYTTLCHQYVHSLFGGERLDMCCGSEHKTSATTFAKCITNSIYPMEDAPKYRPESSFTMSSKDADVRAKLLWHFLWVLPLGTMLELTMHVLVTLLPLFLGLGKGLVKGSILAIDLLPDSGTPSVLLIVGSTMFFWTIALIMTLVMAPLGTLLGTIGTSLVSLSFLAFAVRPHPLFGPSGEVHAILRNRSRFALILRVVGVACILAAVQTAQHVRGYVEHGGLDALSSFVTPQNIVIKLVEVFAAMGCAKVATCDFVVQAAGMALKKEMNRSDSKVDQAQEQQPAGPVPDATASLTMNRMEPNGSECQHEVPCESNNSESVV